MRERLQSLGGEPLRQYHEVGTNVCVRGELLVGVGYEALYRLDGEPALMAHGETGDTGCETFVGKDRVRGRGHGENPLGSKRSAQAGISSG